MAKAPAAPAPAAEAAQSEGGSGSLMIDLSTVGDEQELQVIPRGIYGATVDELTFGHSQASGNPMWTWKFELDASAGDFAGRKVFFHTPFVDAMMPRTKKIISRVAPELLNGAFDPEKVANEGTLIGKACKVRLDIRPYEGKQRNNVRDVLAAGEGGAGFLQQA